MSGAAVLRAGALALVPLAAGAGLVGALASRSGVPFAEAVLLPPDPISPAQGLFAALAILLGLVAIFVAPGLLAMRAFRVRAPNATAAAFAAFTLSNALLAVSWIVAMSVAPGEGGRTCFLLTVASLDVALLLLAVWTAPGAPALPQLPTGERWRDVGLPAGVIAAALALGLLLMPGKLRVEALEGDATEVLGFGASLFHGGVPLWDLESGAWGFYPTFVFVAYPVFFVLAFAGVCEAAVRLPALLFLGVVMLACVDLARRRIARTGDAAISDTAGAGAAASETGIAFRRVLPPILAVGLLSMLVGAYYAGYHPFHGDLGCSPLEEWMVTGFALAAVVLVRDGMPALAALAALLSILAFPSGLMWVALLGGAGVLVGGRAHRGDALRTGAWLAAIAGVAAAAILLHAQSNGSLGPMLAEWKTKYFAGRADFTAESPGRALEALGWFALLSGGVAVLALPLAIVRGDAIARWLALSASLWVGFFLLSPAKNIHYFMPAALLPAVCALRLAARGTCWRSRAAPLVLALSALVVIVLSWPKRVPPYTADREFGRATLFLAATEREAVDMSQVIYNLTGPLWKWRRGHPWSIGPHTWVKYADFDPAPGKTYDFVVAHAASLDPALVEITRAPLPGGGTAVLASARGRDAWRAWRDLTFPLRRDLSRFHYDLGPAP